MNDLIQNIESYIDNANVNFAIMLNGEWGSGKTYFIEHDLKALLTTKHKQLVYVSLNGVHDFSEIATQIVFGAHKSWLGKLAKTFLAPFAVKYLPQQTFDAVIKGLKMGSENVYKIESFTKNDLNPKTHFIVIDDLERFESVTGGVSLSTLVGSLYEEFIKLGYHVLLVGDETKIKDAGFKVAKEKYTRRTLQFAADSEAVAETFIESYVQRRKNYAARVKMPLVALLQKVGVHNLRTMAMIFDSYVDLCVAINDDKLTNNQSERILNCLAPLLIEQSLGVDFTSKKSLDVFSQIEIERYSMQIERTNGGESPKLLDDRQYKRNFIKKYDCALKGAWNYIPSVAEYVVRGVPDREKLVRDLSRFEKVKLSQEKQVIQRLQNSWDELENCELEKCIEDAYAAISRNAYSIDDLLYLHDVLSAVKREKYIYPWPYEKDLLRYFKKAVSTYIAEKGVSDCIPSIEMLRFMAHQKTDRAKLAKVVLLHISEDKKNGKMGEMKEIIECLRKKDGAKAEGMIPQVMGSWHLVRDLYEANLLGDVATLNNYGLKFMQNQLQGFVLTDSHAGNTLKVDFDGFMLFKRLLKRQIRKEKGLKRARLMKLLQVVENCITHMKNTASKTQLVLKSDP